MATPHCAKYLTTLQFPIQGHRQEHSTTQKEYLCCQGEPNNPAIQQREKRQPAQKIPTDLY